MTTHLPFLGSRAVADGRVTRGRLAGPGFRRIGPDVHVDAGAAITLALRARGIALWLPEGVIGGYAAAELLEASCGPEDAPVDVVVGRRRVRAPAGVVIHQDELAEDEVVETDDGVAVTGPRRTAYDLARRLGHVEAVVAVDALAHRGGFDPVELLDHPALRANPRGALRLAPVVADTDRRAESPPETRLRLLLVRGGVLGAVPQVEALDRDGRFIARLDLAWPHLRVALEYQGDHHRADRAQYAKDQVRAADLAAAGWLVLPVTATDLYRRPGALIARVRRALALRAAAARP